MAKQIRLIEREEWQIRALNLRFLSELSINQEGEELTLIDDNSRQLLVT